jgi:Arc/MetJ-type ribon-helix-helix transcriptional regulator
MSDNLNSAYIRELIEALKQDLAQQREREEHLTAIAGALSDHPQTTYKEAQARIDSFIHL